MANELVPKRFNTSSLAAAQTQALIEKYGGSKEAVHIYKEAMQHIVAERVQALKTQYAYELTSDRYLQVFLGADKFTRQAFELSETPSGSEERDAFFKGFVDGLLEHYQNNVNGILEVGVRNIASEEHKPVIVPREEKRRWFG